MATYKPKQANEKALQKFLKSKSPSNADKKSSSRDSRGSSSK